ncbi:MerR family transcriptional regulator [Desulfobacca acetoxidans]|uniref:Regulatory protein MerR n=1 Tax=Desulfobacca acetoxidans (strain ATCC 700848 / DSM 11109 / ASRB2) TaxID=880072 RepID=F2NBX4_DESAR|nr:MerR family transcriptional regulator [Desulfobacca acetoxidans]AEB08051.1 regulatory protein MerR [Desulfobacca acetoxidans DSM 11109]HAY21007.1 MerR family transcriptional regulator [Desulfobacterales bacterium]
MLQTEKRYYSLQIVATTLGVHPQAIRLYEREGLISSMRCGSERYYTISQIERLRVIVQLRQELGVNLAGIEVILHMRDRLQTLSQKADTSPEPGPDFKPPAKITIPIRHES